MSSIDDLLFPIQVPLKVILLTESPGPEHGALRSAITRAFQGGQPSADRNDAYFSAGEDLGVAILEVDWKVGEAAARQIVASARAEALHVLLVPLLYDLPSAAFGQWLTELDKAAHQGDVEPPSLSIMPITVRAFPWSGESQALNYSQLGEHASRPAYAATHTLACAWRMLGQWGEKLRLFISHAKLDGLPLAQSFKHQLQSFHGLELFYDAKDIPPGTNWKRVLHEGVRDSVVVALRTNVYEERFWCVQELDWAEDHGCPIVLVDARTFLIRPREALPVAGAPSVQVPDGNLLRVLQSALREALRVRLFLRQVDGIAATGLLAKEAIIAVPRTSLSTLGMRCQAEVNRPVAPSWVFIPEPLREAHRPIAERLVKAYFPNVQLGTPRDWIDQQLASHVGEQP